MKLLFAEQLFFLMLVKESPVFLSESSLPPSFPIVSVGITSPTLPLLPKFQKTQAQFGQSEHTHTSPPPQPCSSSRIGRKIVWDRLMRLSLRMFPRMTDLHLLSPLFLLWLLGQDTSLELLLTKLILLDEHFPESKIDTVESRDKR